MLITLINYTGTIMYPVCLGDQTILSSRRPSIDGSLAPSGGGGGEKEKGEDSDVQDGRLSVFVHKREDQTSHEVIQPLLR